MKYLTLLSLLILVSSCPNHASAQKYEDEEIQHLLQKLDSLIENKDKYIKEKETKISHLYSQRNAVQGAEQRYWLNKMFYDEYFVYKADSAMLFADENIGIATELGKQDWVAEWKIKKAFLLSATGLLKESQNVLSDIKSDDLSADLRVEYFSQMQYLYSHYGLYSTRNSQLAEKYFQIEKLYKDSINMAITPANHMYLWHEGWNVLGTDRLTNVIVPLKEKVDSCSLQSRDDAMNAYILALLYRETGDWENMMIYMTCSAIADVAIANKDIASLQELAELVFEQDDIDRAYLYINYCQSNALDYSNRVRFVSMGALQDKIQQAYRERIDSQESRIHRFLFAISILAVFLVIAVVYIGRQYRKLRVSQKRLNEANECLNKHREELTIINEKLHSLNSQLATANDSLSESNYVKEEYIGYVFSICSTYISKLEEFRKNINRKLKTGQIDDIKKLTSSTTMAQNELKEFYNSFDTIFLHLYPDFVKDFNTLLQPDKQITLKEGELLTTELRIYALVRLGINDSVKIADFLHCSPQTIYNNRLKTRNKAIIPKETFAQTVMQLGKTKIAPRPVITQE